MRRVGLLFLAVIVLACVLVRQAMPPPKEPEPQTLDTARVEPSPVCPWRNPERDLLTLFPPATNYVLETRIVSGLTAPIRKQLGRSMHPDENPLRIHRVMHRGEIVGSVLVTRIKGEHGAIEIVIGVQTNALLQGVLIQSQREPVEVAGAISEPAWLESFAGKSAQSALQVGNDLPKVSANARTSAEAIARGVHDQLTVLSFAELGQEARERRLTAHH